MTGPAAEIVRFLTVENGLKQQVKQEVCMEKEVFDQDDFDPRDFDTEEATEANIDKEINLIS